MRALLVGVAFLAAHTHAAAQTIPHPGKQGILADSLSAETAAQVSSHTGGKTACTDGIADGYACKGVDMLAHLAMRDYGGVDVNDVWGWTDPETGREYALAGRSDAVAFVDVTNQLNPVYIGELRSHNGETSTWRDMKVYRDHMFVVVDGSGSNGMQVFDLTQLRTFRGDPVRFEAAARYDGVSTAHNLAINEASGFAFLTGAASGMCSLGIHMVDIRTPLEPTYAGCFRDSNTGRGYTHDAQCVVYHGPDSEHAGREICFGSNVSDLSISDVTDKHNPVALSHASYPRASYAHQGWLTDDHRYFIMNDELDEVGQGLVSTRTLIWDLADLDDPVLLTQYLAPTTTIDHNLYVEGNKVFAANYTSGLRIVDITRIEAPKEIAYFDTHPENDDISFRGAWTAYPYLGSGIILVSSYPHGLFVLAETGHDVNTGLAEREREYRSLVALYRATDGARWRQRSNWDLGLTGSRLTLQALEDFHGVTMVLDFVGSLHLAGNNLSGSLPVELGDMQFLLELDLRDNRLEGRLPRSLMQLSRLEKLLFGGQVLCAPSDEAFQSWLGAVQSVSGQTCAGVTLAGAAMLDDLSYTLGESIGELVLPAATGGVAPYTYQIVPALPAGLAFDAETRTLTGTPESLSEATRYTYVATDVFQESDSLEFGIEVVAPLELPGPVDDKTFTRGLDIGELVLPEATGGSAPYSYSLAPELPPGLSFDANTRTLAGVPDSLTPQVRYTYSATDAASRIDSLQFDIAVVVAALALQDSVADQSYRQGIPIVDLVLPEATGGVPPYTYRLLPAPPADLSFDAATLTLSGTPIDVTQPTAHTFTAIDAASGMTSLTFSIEVISTVSSEFAGELPDEFVLQGNFPNPFTTTTTLVFDLPEPAEVSLEVSNILGRRVLELEAIGLPAGRGKTLKIDGQALPPGAYLYRLVAWSEEGEVVRTGALLRVR